MIITVSGLTGSGKNTIGELLATKLNYSVVSPTFKDLAKKEGISLMQFQKKAEQDHDIDKKFDELLKEQVAEAGNCIVTTWLAPWILDADFRVYLDVPEKLRAKRIAKRDNMSEKEALKHVSERDNGNRKRYLAVYNIDIFDRKKFNLIVKNEDSTPEEIVEEIIKKLKGNS